MRGAAHLASHTQNDEPPTRTPPDPLAGLVMTHRSGAHDDISCTGTSRSGSSGLIVDGATFESGWWSA
jgi:hypothetical protein